MFKKKDSCPVNIPCKECIKIDNCEHQDDNYTDCYTVHIKYKFPDEPATVKKRLSCGLVEKIRVIPIYKYTKKNKKQNKLHAFKSREDVIVYALKMRCIEAKKELEGVEDGNPYELIIGDKYIDKTKDELVIELDWLENLLDK
jgi:hypothetical protein